jgi:YD repeat-containing protein
LKTTIIVVIALAIGCGGPVSNGAAPAKAGPGKTPSKTLGTPSAGYSYAYDAAGRLTVVTAPDGEAAEYVYDPAGNILAIDRYSATSLAVLGFSPARGTAGDLVTVSGVGFSAVAAENAVSLNGTAATVISSTPAQLTFAVPAAASTGIISVTVTGTTATSSASFTVAPGVAITSFTPSFGTAGAAITIAGQGELATMIHDSESLYPRIRSG